MRHRKKQNKLGRKKSSRKSMLTNLIASLILYEKINTTRARAKALQPKFEKMISLSKTKSFSNKQKLSVLIRDKNAEKKVREVLSEKYKNRQGGYTRIISLGLRKGDDAKLVQIELV